jgi:type II secretory pathway pseudopilin PulG
MKRFSLNSRKQGATLIELLVTIVIFLVGILAVAQIFPGGLRILDSTRNTTIAGALVRTESDRLKGLSNQMPERIVPVRYDWRAATLVISAQTDTPPTALIPPIDPATTTISNTGDIIEAGVNLGGWEYIAGPNIMRRIVGEAGGMGSPTQLPSGEFGSQMYLLYAPIVDNLAYPSLLTVYGNDLGRRFGNPPGESNQGTPEIFETGRVRQDLYWLSSWNDPDAFVALPKVSGRQMLYRVSATLYYDDGDGNVRSVDVIDADPVVVAPTVERGYQVFPLVNLLAVPGINPSDFIGVSASTVRVQRLFDRLDPIAPWTPGDPYQYKVDNADTGLLVFNPAAFGATVTRNDRSVPLTPRVNYDVFDWRILRQEFRVPVGAPPVQKLMMGNLMVKDRPGADGQRYNGMNLLVPYVSSGAIVQPNPANTLTNPDFILVDVSTGGVVLFDPQDPTRGSYLIDKSSGVVTFNDVDNDFSNGIQGYIGVRLPNGQWQLLPPQNMEGRPVRALFRAFNEWAVQPISVPTDYRLSWNRPNIGQYYVGGSNPLVGGDPYRIYFTDADINQTIMIQEAWFTNVLGQPQVLENQSFVVRRSAADPFGPFIDIRDAIDPAILPGAGGGFNYSRGYAVRSVRGSTLRVRATWNIGRFNLTGDTEENLVRFERWAQNWRTFSVETFSQRGEQ